MLAAIAPSVAGWPAAKPRDAEAMTATVMMPDADAEPVDDVLADEQPAKVRRAPTGHRESA